MKTYNRPITILWLLLLSFGLAAQSYTAGDPITLQIQSFSLIATNNAPVNLTLGTNVAGAKITGASNSDVFVRMSSIVPGNTHREITARIAYGTVPAGTQLKLSAAACTTANSGGVLGVPAQTPVVLDASDKVLIDLIGTGFTGTGVSDGYRLTYTWEPVTSLSDYGLISATTSPVSLTVILTITAHNSN